MSPSSHPRAIAAAVAVTVLWSSSWVLIRWGLDDHGLRPVGFAGLRYGVAALILIGWVLTRRSLRTSLRRITPRDFARLSGLGIVFYTVTQGAQFIAIDNQPAATTSLVLSTTPLVVSVVSRRILGEAPTAGQVAGTVLIAGGALAYFAGELGFTGVGLIAALTALAGNAAAALVGRAMNRTSDMPPTLVTAVSMGVGAVGLATVGIGAEGLPRLEWAGWAIVAWLAVVNTTVAFTWWNWSLRHLSATASAGINNTMLIQIALWGWAFLGEAPGVIQWLGMFVLSAGVFWSQARKQ